MDRTSPLSDFQLLLKSSFSSIVKSSENAYSIQGPQETHSGPRELHSLFEHVRFSRNLILTYILLQLILLLAFTVFHWVGRFRNWRESIRKRRTYKTWDSHSRIKVKPSSLVTEVTDGFGDGSSQASSSSSTLREIPQSIKDENSRYKVDEQSPLLLTAHDGPKRSQGTHIGLKIKSWLVYQPRPIDFINKTPSANATTVVVLVMIGIQIFYSFYRVPLSIPTVFVLADRTSLVFAANLPLLYFLAAKNQPIRLLTGYSYESLNIFHRRLGEILCLLALLHSVGMVAVWYTLLRPAGLVLIEFLLKKIILWGMAAFVAYESLYFTSLGSFRQRWYELFLGLHVVLQTLALVFLWLHHHGSRPYVGAALTIFLIDRFVYRMFLKTKTVTGTLEVKDDKATVIVRMNLARPHKQRLVNRFLAANIANGWKPTEHIFLAVPSLSRKHIIQAHPFTIASKAPCADGTSLNLELIIRAQDGFSRDLLHHAQNHATISARLDGPYGSQSAVRMLQTRTLSIIVAGGSGIAVAWPLVHSLLSPPHHDATDPEAPTRRPGTNILFLWIIRDPAHKAWLDANRLADLERSYGVHVLIPPPTVHHGHPDMEHLLRTWIGARTECFSHNGDSGGGGRFRIGVVCSGPDALNRRVRNVCSRLLWQGHDVGIEIEKFGW